MQPSSFKTPKMGNWMILVLAEDYDIHTDKVIESIQQKGGDVLRINPERLDERLHEISYQHDYDGNLKGNLRYLNREIDVADINSVFCRNYHFIFAEEDESKSADDLLIAKELEAAFKGFCETLNCAWTNAPWDMDACDSKVKQMQVARRIGFMVPDLLVTNQTHALLQFKSIHNLVVKQLSNICVFEEDGVSAKSLYTHLLDDDDLKHIEDLQHSPAFFNTFIDKVYDVRVTVIGNDMYAVRIDSQKFKESKVDFRRKEGDLNIEVIELKNTLSNRIINLMKHLKLNFAALDFAVDINDHYWFLEINSEGNWLWMEEELNLPISSSIAHHLLSTK